MTDIALFWDAAAFAGDMVLADGQIVSDGGMRTAILISLFTDARAPGDAELPAEGDDRRGWWGDAYPGSPNFQSASEVQTGSLLWLLKRSKVNQIVINQARVYARDALQWLVDDRIVRTLDVEVERLGDDTLAIGVTLTRPDGPTRERYDFVWSAPL